MNALAFRPLDEAGPALAVAHPEPTLTGILAYVASAYEIDEGHIRLGVDDLAAGARDEFLWLCEQLKAVSALACASYIGAPISDVIGAIANVERQRAADRDLRDRLDEACLTLHCEAMALARLGRPAPESSRPVDIARRVMVSRRAAGMASVEDIQSLAGGYLSLMADRDAEALHRELDVVRHELAASEEANERLRAELASAEREATLAKARWTEPAPRPETSVPVSHPHPLEAVLREFVLAAAEVDRASGPYERTARIRFDKACQTLALAGEKHFNIKRTFK